MSLFTTTITDSNSSSSGGNGEPAAKKYRYTSEQHPFRIFEDFNFDDLDSMVGHHFAEVSRITNFTAASATSAKRRHPARNARRDEHCHQQLQQATAPRRVSVTSMDDKDIADDNQEHNDDTTTTSNTCTTTASTFNATPAASRPRNISLQLFELMNSDAATRNTANTCTAKDELKTNNASSLPSLA